MNRSSAISRRASMAPNRLRTEVSPKPSSSSSVIFSLRSSQREDVGRLVDPALLVEQLDLLLAQAVDVEGAARHEMLAGARPPGTGQANSPVQRASAPSSPVAVASRTTSVCSGHGHFFGKFVGLGARAAACPARRRAPAE